MPETELRCVLCGRTRIDTGEYLCVPCSRTHKDRYGHMELIPTHQVTLATPKTPLMVSGSLGKPLGIDWLGFKLESSNPTGSYKDRPAASMVRQAMALGKTDVCCASSGNAAVALSFAATNAGLKCHVFVPEHASEAKLGIIGMFGAELRTTAGSFEDAYGESLLAMEKNGWYNCNAGMNPHAIDGCKEIAFEIFAQVGVPDAVIVPVGDGTNLAGIWKGFKELMSSGLASTAPVMISVQVKGGDPVTKAFEKGTKIEIVDNPPCSVAEGIIASESYNIIHAIRALKESGGTAISVSEGDVKRGVIDMLKEGIVAEPTSASVVAGLKLLAERKFLKPGQKIVCVVTGSGFKTMKEIENIISSQK